MWFAAISLVRIITQTGLSPYVSIVTYARPAMNDCYPNSSRDDDVMRLADSGQEAVATLLSAYGLSLKTVPAGEDIPGSFWGDEEAGLVGDDLLARLDTPLHSVLHEACHYVCMDQARRAGLDTDAGGGYDEENAVCYLQVLLADHIDGFGRERMFKDMDRWGYSFRLGSAQAWFERDAQDAVAWLERHGLVDRKQRPTLALREK
jgi:hypothetical protein